MTKITCDMCMDLMPLVQDGVASADSMEAVKEHIKTCPSCKSVFEGIAPPPADGNQIMKKIQQKTRLFMGMILMFGVLFGLSLTATSELFLNTLIMPVIGAVGYYLFCWKSSYITPGLILVTHLVINTFGLLRGIEHLDYPSLFLWSGIYALFAGLGTVIAGLIHFALRKED